MKMTWAEAQAKLKAEWAEQAKTLIAEAFAPLDEKLKKQDEVLTELRAKQTEFMSQGMRRLDPDDKPSKEKLGLRAARIVRAMAAAKGDPDRCVHVLERQYGDADTATAVKENRAKAMMSSIGDIGGILVPEGDVQEIIELLRPASVVRASGATVVPMPNGTLPFPKQTGGSTAQYIGEGATQNASRLTLALMTLIWKKLRALVPLTQELVRMASPSADLMVRNDLVRSLATAEDQAFIRGDGLAANPRGIRYQLDAAHIIASGSADDGSVPTLAEVENDLRRMLALFLGADIPMDSTRWLNAPRSRLFLQFLRDAVGFKAFPELSLNPQQLLGFSHAESNNVPSNLAGVGAQTLSEAYLVNFSDCIIAETSTLEISASSEASFHNEAGNVESAYDADLVIIKAIERHDFGMRRAKSGVCLTGVLWGAQ